MAASIEATLDVLQFWGKARPSGDDGPTWHPAACHSLDVAAVADVLLSSSSSLDALACRCGLEDPRSLHGIAVLLIALHDIGKFSRAFQMKVSERWPTCLGDCMRGTDMPHDSIGLAFLCGDGADDELGNRPLDRFFPHWHHTRVNALFRAVAGHHGRPAREPPQDGLPLSVACQVSRQAAATFIAETVTLLRPLPLDRQLAKYAEILSWWLAGLTTVCDWIGSSQRWFPYVGDGFMSLEAYWPIACRRAKQAVAECGLQPAPAAPWRNVQVVIGDRTASPVQEMAAKLDIETASCIIVEDTTGSGKTEAALILAHRLISAGRADGIFFALPTMATADGMFGRLATSYRRLFADDASPFLALAHGRALLNEQFTGSIVLSREPDEATASKEAADVSASSQCSAWLADERRRTFLADVGVGTIDQALLAALTARHAALRLFGLARKVLVIDEAHAFDIYMNTVLDRLLRFHALLGGVSIILSATLPASRRAELLTAQDEEMAATQSQAYPLITVAGSAGPLEYPTSIRAGLRRTLPCTRLETADAAAQHVIEAARAGACVIWIRNTVDDARQAQAMVMAGGVPASLFHARLAMGDRLKIQDEVLQVFGLSRADMRAPNGMGYVLVATQVVEQSLDIDADVLVSDLAPIDLLIQRAGRLQRHRHKRPAIARVPELFVVSPKPVASPAADWTADPAIGGSRFVYPPHLLWRTARSLFSVGCIIIPNGVRPLVESVYGEEAEAVPASLEQAETEFIGKEAAARSSAQMNLLDPSQGYGRASGDWAADHRVPTRLGDEQTIFRMAKWVDDKLVPWIEHPELRKAWSLSEISLRRDLADGETLDSLDLQAVAELKQRWTAWEQELPLLVLRPVGGGQWRCRAARREAVVELGYSPTAGLSRIDGSLPYTV